MENEVETILNEIRERVRAESEPNAVSGGTTDNGHPESAGLALEKLARQSESMARLSAGLTVTGRAWDRLPPVFSNRTGAMARFELWVKARFKSLTRWFIWEQVNFNAAVHHALKDILEELTALNAMQSVANQENAALRARLEEAVTSIRTNMTTQIENIKARLKEADARSSEQNSRLSELAAQIDTLIKETDARLSELAADLRAEQRVSFKQLSLEASEAAVLEDRGRRAIESRLQELEKFLKSEQK